MVCDPQIKRILVRVPTAIKSAWTTAPDNLFETVNYDGSDEDWLILFLSPIGGWRRTNNFLDGEPTPQFSSNVALLQTSRVYRSWDGNVEGCRAEVFGILEEIAATATESNECDAYTPIVIQDYATPEYVNLRTALNASSEPTTQRQGILTLSEPTGLVKGQNDVLWMPGGFRFRFQELEARTA